MMKARARKMLKEPIAELLLLKVHKFSQFVKRSKHDNNFIINGFFLSELLLFDNNDCVVLSFISGNLF